MSTNKFDALITSDDSDSEDLVNSDQNSAASRAKLTKLLSDVTVPDDEHRLQSTYSLWYSRKGSGGHHKASFDQNLQLIGAFATCEQFWQVYSHLGRPGDLSSHSDFHVFKKGIKPLWEDDANRYGGKWIVRLRKGLASRCWENLIMAMLGEQFMVGEEICGAVVSIRYQEDILSIWNRSGSDTGVTNRIRDTFRRVLNLPPGTITEYKAHNDSIKYAPKVAY
jgi:translation initiation factor 4E